MRRRDPLSGQRPTTVVRTQGNQASIDLFEVQSIGGERGDSHWKVVESAGSCGCQRRRVPRHGFDSIPIVKAVHRGDRSLDRPSPKRTGLQMKSVQRRLLDKRCYWHRDQPGGNARKRREDPAIKPIGFYERGAGTHRSTLPVETRASVAIDPGIIAYETSPASNLPPQEKFGIKSEPVGPGGSHFDGQTGRIGTAQLYSRTIRELVFSSKPVVHHAGIDRMLIETHHAKRLDAARLPEVTFA